MDMPCMSCGGSTRETPGSNEHGRCLHPHNHATPEKHQVWLWLNNQWEIRGTGLVVE